MVSKKNFINGITDMLVLYILRSEDAYPYDIAKQIKSLSDGKLDISLNTLYTVIYKLGAAGYISEYTVRVGKKRTRVYCHLEPSGYEYSEHLYNEYSSFTSIIMSTLKNMNLKEDFNH